MPATAAGAAGAGVAAVAEVGFVEVAWVGGGGGGGVCRGGLGVVAGGGGEGRVVFVDVGAGIGDGGSAVVGGPAAEGEEDERVQDDGDGQGDEEPEVVQEETESFVVDVDPTLGSGQQSGQTKNTVFEVVPEASVGCIIARCRNLPMPLRAQRSPPPPAHCSS